jgi:TetR/AcrR family transcriptional regulator
MVKRSLQPQDRDTEQRILDAAHAVFLRRGTAGARTQEIAKEAGVNPALLHYYFRSKARLAEAVFQRAASSLMPAVIGILASNTELEGKVRQVIDVELRQLSKTPYLPGYIISELTYHPDRMKQLFSTVTGMAPGDIGGIVRRRLGAQIAARVRAGSMHPIEPEQFAVNLLALCIFPFAARPLISAMLSLDEKGFTAFIDRRRKDLVSFFLRALRP